MQAFQMVIYWEQSASQKEWTISFGASSAIWRYFFVGVSSSTWKNLEMPTTHTNKAWGDITFKKWKDPQEMPNGQRAFLFSSIRSIPWADERDWEVKVIDSNYQIESSLPHPTPNLIRKCTNPGSGIAENCVDLYIQY